MIQVQNVQQQPSQDVREQLYSQLEDYMGLSSTKKKMDSSEKSGGTTLKRKSSEQSSSSSSSKALSKNTLAIKVNGKTIKGSAQNIVGRVVEAEMGASFREEALKAQAVAAYTYIRYNNQKGTIPSLPAKSSVSAKVEDAVEQVISATSLVISIEAKNGSITSDKVSRRLLFLPASIRWDSTRKVPSCCIPATAAIRQNSSSSTRRSIYSRYCAEGGTHSIETTAQTAAMTKTGSCFKNRLQFCIFPTPHFSLPV